MASAARTIWKPRSSGPSQKTHALGVRWDAFKSAAVKLQVDRIDTSDTKGASFTTPTVLGPVAPGFPPRVVGKVSGPVTVVSVTVDFTF